MPQAYRQAKQQAAASQKNHSSSFIPMTFPFAARLKSIQDFFFEASLATQRECVVIGLLLTHLLLGLAYMFSANVKIYQSGLVIGLVGLGVSALTSGLSPASSSSSASSIDSTGIRVGPEVSQSSTGDASWIGPQAILLVMLLSAPFPMACNDLFCFIVIHHPHSPRLAALHSDLLSSEPAKSRIDWKDPRIFPSLASLAPSSEEMARTY